MQNDNLKLKILILGGGFGGIRCALDLSKKIGDKAKITLIDKNSYHLFVPALYEVASAYGVKKDPFAVRLKKTIRILYSDIFSAKGGPASGGGKINFIQAEISAIDLANKKIATSGGEILDYNYLVIALGSQAADFDIPGVREYAFQFKNLEDALLLNQKINELTKEVVVGVRARPIKIAVVGAGFTGIEVAAEFACYIKKLSKACGIKGRCERIMLLETGPKILSAISNSERIIILKRLTRLGIEVMTGAAAEEVGRDYIKLKNGRYLDVDVAIWTAGIRPLDLLIKTSALPLTEKEKIKVNNNLGVKGLPGVFAIGDNIEFIDPKTDKSIPALAYVAADQGKNVAKNILRLINYKKPVAYNPFYSVWIAPIGGKYALAHLRKGINIKGFWGWVIRQIVDLRYMLSILPFKKAVLFLWREITLFTKND
jgi:NADH dehydrogenase